MEKWYVLHSKPRYEDFLWKQLCMRKLESYYPCLRVRTVNPRARTVQPYFPGYLFVSADLDVVGISYLQWMPGSAGLVRFGEEPATISENLLLTIKQRIEGLEQTSSAKTVPFQKGDVVLVRNGVFKGYEGIFDVCLSGADRVRILLSLLGDRQMAVELPADCICSTAPN